MLNERVLETKPNGKQAWATCKSFTDCGDYYWTCFEFDDGTRKFSKLPKTITVQ